jgi:DNA-binding IclR family transcriptional regulator
VRELWCSHERRAVPFPAADLPALVAEVRARGMASDLGPNTNGVLRVAAPLLDTAGALVGAVAVARVDPPGAPDRRTETLALVKEAVERMGKFVGV